MNDYLQTNTGKTRSHFSLNDVAQFLLVLLVAKFLKSAGIYLFYDLLKHIHVVQLLFFATPKEVTDVTAVAGTVSVVVVGFSTG